MEVYTLSDVQYEMVLAYINNNELPGGATIFVDQAPDGKVIVTSGTAAPTTGLSSQAATRTSNTSGDYVTTVMKPGASPELYGNTTNPKLSRIYNVIGILGGVVYLVWQVTNLVFTIQDRNDARRRKQSDNDGRASN